MIRVLLAALAWCMLAAAADAREAILDYQSRIVVNADASLTVTENIRVRVEGRTIKRGIFRGFPTLYRDREGRRVNVPFAVLEVLRDGKPEPFHIEPAANGKLVYIGRSDARLRSGEYTYTLTYETDRQIGYFADYDELYWNVTGSDWSLARDRITAVVVPPPGAPVLRHAAYAGPTGSQGTAFAVDRDENGDLRFRTTRVLGMGEDLTVAVAWPKGFVAEPDSTARLGYALADNADALAGAVGLLLVLGVSFLIWLRVGRDPARGTIVPLFEPPKGLSPAAVRYVLRMGFDDKAFAAAVVDMAVKGALTIDVTGRSTVLRRLDPTAAGLSPGERRIAGKLFALQRDAVAVKDGNHAILGDARDALEATLKGEYGRAFFARNAVWLAPGAVLSILAVAAMIVVSPVPEETGAGLVMGGFGLAALLGGLWFGARNLLVFVSRGRGAFTRLKAGIFGVVLAVMGICAAIGIAVLALDELPPVIPVLMALLVAVNLVFFRIMQAPTAAGRKIMDAIEGFRMYLSVAERDRLDVLHPPEMTLKLFEKYLPYALALDVETAWTNRFVAALDVAESQHPVYNPLWYHGLHGDFRDLTRTVDTLGGAFVGTLASAATPPGSSGDGGSGGGGFSGGGGGGGGGGGW